VRFRAGPSTGIQHLHNEDSLLGLASGLVNRPATYPATVQVNLNLNQSDFFSLNRWSASMENYGTFSRANNITVASDREPPHVLVIYHRIKRPT
jgi:hypothetical protein